MNNALAAAGDPESRVELRPAPAHANALPLLAKLLRRIRDRERAARPAEPAADTGPNGHLGQEG